MAHDSDGGNNSIKKVKVIKGFGLQFQSIKLEVKASSVKLCLCK